MYYACGGSRGGGGGAAYFVVFEGHEGAFVDSQCCFALCYEARYGAGYGEHYLGGGGGGVVIGMLRVTCPNRILPIVMSWPIITHVLGKSSRIRIYSCNCTPHRRNKKTAH